MLTLHELRARRIALAKDEVSHGTEPRATPGIEEFVGARPAIETDHQSVRFQHAIGGGHGGLEPVGIGIVLQRAAKAVVVAIALFGWWVWPRITVSPTRISFAGYPNETFNFSVRNQRADDVYDVQIPFLIGYNKHLDDKLSVKVASNGDPPQRLYDDYNYCFGVGKDIKKVMPHEREVLIVRIRHLPPFGIGSFSITYAGGEKFETKSGTPNFISEPYSYSPMQGTVWSARCFVPVRLLV